MPAICTAMARATGRVHRPMANMTAPSVSSSMTSHANCGANGSPMTFWIRLMDPAIGSAMDPWGMPNALGRPWVSMMMPKARRSSAYRQGSAR